MKRIYIDMDNVLVDFQSGIDQLDEQTLDKYKKQIYNTPGIYAKMKPMEGAAEAFNTLMKDFDVYILSTPPWDNQTAWSDKLEWVKEHLGKSARKRLILSHHKNLCEGDYIIDDRTRNGVDKFKGKHIHFGESPFEDWDKIISYFNIELATEVSREVVYVDMDNVLVDFKSAFEHLTPEVMKEYEGRLDEVPHIFSLMAPLSGAIESYRALVEKYDVYILSTSPWENPTALQDKLDWVKRYLGDVAYKRVIFSHHKNLSRGSYLIDDRTKNGAGEFRGKLIQLGSDEFPHWRSVVKYLKV